MKLKLLTHALLLALVLPATAAAQTPTGYDQRFLQNAIEGNRGEVQLAQLAAQRSSSSAVQDLASVLIADHSRSLQQAEQLAQQKGVQVPTGILPGQQRLLNELTSDADNNEFDKDFVNGLIDEHEEDVGNYAQYDVDAADPDIRGLAEQDLPVLVQHLARAIAVRAVVEADSTSLSSNGNAATGACPPTTPPTVSGSVTPTPTPTASATPTPTSTPNGSSQSSKSKKNKKK